MTMVPTDVGTFWAHFDLPLLSAHFLELSAPHLQSPLVLLINVIQGSLWV